jgi:hypothetical protein
LKFLLDRPQRCTEAFAVGFGNVGEEIIDARPFSGAPLGLETVAEPVEAAGTVQSFRIVIRRHGRLGRRISSFPG